MLNRIFIQNFALIDQLEIHLQKGLQVITGETGAENLLFWAHFV
jgi:DNA repair protein RecN (Recombination protein N)